MQIRLLLLLLYYVFQFINELKVIIFCSFLVPGTLCLCCNGGCWGLLNMALLSQRV